MLTKKENDVLTQTGPGTPGDVLMRSYWQPVALSEELPVGGDPLPVRLLGEDLVLFRDDKGHPGLLGLQCPHRCTDLSYGRIEDGGLRCIYHGWLFDVSGNCLEQPGEPKGSTFHEKVKHLAYPCTEAGGMIFAYMGEGEPPLFPAYEFLNVPEENRHVTKVLHECNYLQGNEGNIDPAHLSFLHLQIKDDESVKQMVKGSNASKNILFGKNTSPTIELEQTDFGIRIYSVRYLENGSNFVRITNFIYPNLTTFPGNTAPDGYAVNWHVPIDDTHHWKYVIAFTRSKPLDKEKFYKSNYEGEFTEDYKPVRNKKNRYLQDRRSMNKYYAGVGHSFPIHDLIAVESQGDVLDRTKEHLGYSDKAIAMMRRLLLRAVDEVQEGRKAPHVITNSEENRLGHMIVISEVVTGNWKKYIENKITTGKNES